DLVAVQTEICNEVFASLQGIGQLTQTNERSGTPRTTLTEAISEEYLQARAMLSSFMQRTGSRSDLDRARELFENVTQRDTSFAPAFTGLGITHLQYVRHGFGGRLHVMDARRAFDRALEI